MSRARGQYGTRAACHPDRPHDARGLCSECYEGHRWAGTLHRFPRVTRPAAELVAAAERARAAEAQVGLYLSWDEVAELVGVKPKTLERARERVARRNERACT